MSPFLETVTYDKRPGKMPACQNADPSQIVKRHYCESIAFMPEFISALRDVWA
jgi:hypothetical protein